jgi:hypothetical protein
MNGKKSKFLTKVLINETLKRRILAQIPVVLAIMRVDPTLLSRPAREAKKTKKSI